MKIAICTPVYERPTAAYVQCLARLLTARVTPAGPSAGLQIETFIQPGLLQIARTQLVNAALKWGADKILWIDSDQTFPPDTLIRLLARQLPIIGANYLRRVEGAGAPVAFTKEGHPCFTTAEKAKAQELEEVGGMGLGLCMMDASIFRGMEKPWFQITMDGNDSYELEDLYMFRKAGVPIIIDHALSWQVGHLFEQVLTYGSATQNQGLLHERLARMRQRPAR